MVDHVLPSHISMIDSIHGFKNPSQETFGLWFRIVGGEGSRLRKNSYIFTFFGERPFWYVFWNGFWIRKEYWQHYFSLETQAWINVFLDSWVRGGVNIFLPVFKSLKFSLQYEILNLEVFLQINRANYALVVANTNFHFQTSLNQFWILVKATCFFMVQNHWYVQ